MSGECDKCGEHTLDCWCEIKNSEPEEDNDKDVQMFYAVIGIFWVMVFLVVWLILKNGKVI